MNTALYEFLRTQVPEECIKRDEPMADHTTFRVGGNADFFVEIGSSEELAGIIKYLKQTERSYFILGNGSNLLVGDKGYEGVILHLGSRFDRIDVDGKTIRAQAGALLSVVAKTAGRNGLTGLEFASGIPGTIGGAVVMNAGAYDGGRRNSGAGQRYHGIRVSHQYHQKPAFYRAGSADAAGNGRRGSDPGKNG